MNSASIFEIAALSFGVVDISPPTPYENLRQNSEVAPPITVYDSIQNSSMFLFRLIFVRNPLVSPLDLHHLTLYRLMHRLRVLRTRLCFQQDVLPVHVNDLSLPHQHLQGIRDALLGKEPGA